MDVAWQTWSAEALNRPEQSLRIQNLLNRILVERPVVYGPGKVSWDKDDNAIILRPNWKLLIREALRSARKRGWPRVPKVPAASCSVFANLVAAYWVGARHRFRSRNGRSMTKAVARSSKRGGYLEYAKPLFGTDRKGRAKFVSQKTLAKHALSLSPVNILFLRRPGLKWYQRVAKWRPWPASHVICVIKAEDGLRIFDPRTGEKCEGLYRLAADGNRETGEVWRFSCRPLTFVSLDLRGWEARVYALRDPDWTTGGFHGAHPRPRLRIEGNKAPKRLLEG